MHQTASPVKIESPPRPRAEGGGAPRIIARIIARIALYHVAAALCLALFIAGDALRRWAWQQTTEIRFTADVSNGYRWGSTAVDNGLLNVYRTLVDSYQGDDSPDYRLDYPPLRLAFMSGWVRWTRSHFDDARRWRPDYAFHRSILLLNTFCEALAALGVFGVVRAMARRASPQPWAGTIPAVIGALLVWFNAAVVFNDCWPQWDAWILPCFVIALYLSMHQRWLGAGVLLAVGTMLKGQLLMVAPIFVLWPLFSGQWSGVVQLIVGFAFGFTAIAAPWTLTSRADFVVVAAGLVAAVALLVWPFVPRAKRWSVSLRWRVIAAAAVVAGCIALTPFWFSGDLAWFQVGFGYGSRKFMHMGEHGTSNLAMLLQESWGWRIIGPSGTFMLPLSIVGLSDVEATMRSFLVGLYGITLVLSAIGAAIHWRRRSQRFLVAMYAPWVLCFALLPQLNNRYLYWGAALFGMMAAVGAGPLLIGLFLSLACCLMMAEVMCRFESGAWPLLQSISAGVYPGLAYAVLLAAAVLLYIAVAPDQRRSKSPSP